MLAVRLSNETEQRIIALTEKTGHTKSYYVRKAVERFLEDEEDYLLAISRLEENNIRLPFEEIKRLVDMED